MAFTWAEIYMGWVLDNPFKKNKNPFMVFKLLCLPAILNYSLSCHVLHYNWCLACGNENYDIVVEI